MIFFIVFIILVIILHSYLLFLLYTDNSGIKGLDGQNGQVTNKFMQTNSLWCTDSQICKIPSQKIGIDYGGAQMYNVINSRGLLSDFNINTLNDLYINGNTLHITQNKLYSNSRDILAELDLLKYKIEYLQQFTQK